MCQIADPRGEIIDLPPDLPVSVCHRCERFAVRYKQPQHIQRAIRTHLNYGRLARLKELAPRPVCVECSKLGDFFGEVA